MTLPSEMTNLNASSTEIFSIVVCCFGNINTNPEVGFGVVGINTVISSFSLDSVRGIVDV